MRLFVSVGNATVGFDRLLHVVEASLRSVPLEVEGLCQRGASKAAVPGLETVDFLSREEFEKEMREANVVICHGGVGTIRSALSSGHRPLVMARRASLGEHINEHQTELVEALAAEDLVTVILDSGSACERDSGCPAPSTSGTPGERCNCSDQPRGEEECSSRKFRRNPGPPTPRPRSLCGKAHVPTRRSMTLSVIG